MSNLLRVELTSGSWRSKSCHWFTELPWNIGHLSLGLLVYLIPNMRYLELFIGLSALPFMSFWYLLPESPRWLLSKGRNEEAIKVVNLACKWNKKDVLNINNLTLVREEEKENIRMGTFKDLIKFPAMRRNAFCMTICWLAFSMGYFGLVYNTPSYDWNIYLVFILPTFVTIPFCLLAPWVENKCGRKPVMTFSLLMAGVALLLTMVVPEGWPVIMLSFLGTISCGMAFGDGYTFTKELFPTILRTTALGKAPFYFILLLPYALNHVLNHEKFIICL